MQEIIKFITEHIDVLLPSLISIAILGIPYVFTLIFKNTPIEISLDTGQNRFVREICRGMGLFVISTIMVGLMILVNVIEKSQQLKVGSALEIITTILYLVIGPFLITFTWRTYKSFGYDKVVVTFKGEESPDLEDYVIQKRIDKENILLKKIPDHSRRNNEYNIKIISLSNLRERNLKILSSKEYEDKYNPNWKKSYERKILFPLMGILFIFLSCLFFMPKSEINNSDTIASLFLTSLIQLYIAVFLLITYTVIPSIIFIRAVITLRKQRPQVKKYDIVFKKNRAVLLNLLKKFQVGY